MRASILCATNGLPGMLYSSVELARRLSVAGHQLNFAGPAAARGLAEQHDLDFLPLDPSRYDEFVEADARKAVTTRLMTVSKRRGRAADLTAVGGFVRAVRDLAPDLLLIDGEMHEHIIAAWGTGVPIALLNTFVSIWRRAGLPPPHCLVRPGVGWQGSRVGMWLLWLALRLRKRRRAASLKIRRIGCDRLSVLRRLAEGSGFDSRRGFDFGQWLIPVTYRSLPVLSLHALEFEFPHRPLASVRYVGPMVLESRSDRSLAEADRKRLDAVLERRRRAGADRRLIAAAFGSCFTTDLQFLKRLLGIVGERPGWELVLSLSDRAALQELGPLPERVHAFAWLPQPEVLRHSDVMVTHGGINTIDECVLDGVPVLVYCGFETDMAGNTARVLHHGIGLAGDRSRDDTEDIRHHVDRLLQEPQFGDNLRRMRLHYEAYAEQRVAERAVDALLARESHDRIG